MEALEDGTIHKALDGFLKNKTRTNAWRIEPRTKNALSKYSVSGAGPVDGDPNTLNPTRTERSGFFGPIFYSYALAEKYDVKKGHITMHVNNIASFQKGDLPIPGEGPLHHHCGDYDLKAINK